MTDHWDAIRRHWQLLGSPLCPPAEAVAAYERELGLRSLDVVLLGVTPELAGLGRTLLAVDESAAMISGIWPGDTASRKAVAGNWFELPLANGSADAVIGDGCLSALDSSAARLTLLAEIARVLKPGARAALRAYASPDVADDLQGVRTLALSGGVATFHELKWRIAMSRAAGDPDHAIPVRAILDAFDALFPDREELVSATGWELPVIGTIDAYTNSQTVYSFAPIARLIEEASRWFDDVRMASTGTYGLAERCPLIVLGSPKRL
ncbi:class I SAM-dependent methyltransferase [Mesorhizobium sp.]|jgi:SAM-dependent methyltransferase|uniref:class I SAM-dependent methyltransferase n=1 Tax=Mesorhizobium sp. TaxID=1871066 RepID=UPI00356AA4E6